MALEGTIKDFGLPDIFQLIGLQRKTGILTLNSAQEKVAVTFDNGMVVAADSSAKRLEDRVGNVLVKQGKLGKDKLEEMLQVQKQTLQRLGHILVSSGAVSPQDLKHAIQVQVSGIVFKLFRWKEGEYHFAPTESADYDREHFNPMSADFILMEGIRMVDEWPIIEKKIPTLDIVFRSAVDTSLIETGGGGEDGLDDAPGGLSEAKAPASNKVRLTGEELKVFRKVDGTNTVQSIVDSCGLGEFDTCRVLFDLLNRNIIAPVGRGTARQAIAEQAGAASWVPGYALAAVALILSAVGVWFHGPAPFGITGRPPLLDVPFGLLLEDVSRTRLERLDRAVLAYHLAKGEAPESLEQLVDAALLDRRLLLDARGRPFEYLRTDTGYRIRSAQGVEPPGPEVQRQLSATP